MPVSRRSALAAPPLVLLGLASSRAAAADRTEDAGALRAGPVQLLPLTDSAGRLTDLAHSGQDGAAAPAPSPQGTRAGAGPAPNSAARPGAVAKAVRLPATSAGAGDPEKEAALLTDPVEVDSFLVAGFTWEGGGLPQDVQVYLRVRENGQWSPWYLNEAGDAGRDDDAGRAGTGEFVTGGATAVQAAVIAPDVELPAGLTLALIPSDPQGETVLQAEDLPAAPAEPTAVAGQAVTPEPREPDAVEPSPADRAPAGGQSPAPVAPASVAGQEQAVRPASARAHAISRARPAVLPQAGAADLAPVAVTSRAQWGANAALLTWKASDAPAKHVVVHHTAGTNNYTPAQSASIVRGIYHYHAVTLGWGDIGYNYLVDKYGKVFEGRSGTLGAPRGRMVVGAHAYGANTGSLGISMMGNHSTVAPSGSQLDAVGRLAGWFLARAGAASATGSAPFTFRSSQKYKAGQTINLASISAHRDVGYTACPGEAGYAHMGRIRAIAQGQLSGSPRWTASGSTWYLVGPNGTRLTGWQFVGGSWYYLASSGAMATGWVKVGGSWYYLAPSGAMATGRHTINGRTHTFDASRAWRG